MPSIAAVFATMNRSATALACVRALAAQTRPPELVVVADNVSTDETVAELERLQELPFRLIVHRMDQNRGNAGGVQEAMDLAFAEGAGAVWILDDDSWPRPRALEELMKEPWDPQVVRHSLQIDPNSGKFTWPLQIKNHDGNLYLVYTAEDLSLINSPRSQTSWTGALVSHEVRQKVGAVNGALFIRGEDEEYPYRIRSCGYRFIPVINSILDHPGPADIICWKFFGKHLFFEPGLADWKLYYKIRNMVWLKKKQSGNCTAIAMCLAYLIATARIDGLKRMPLAIEAMRDGWRGRLGKWMSSKQ